MNMLNVCVVRHKVTSEHGTREHATREQSMDTILLVSSSTAQSEERLGLDCLEGILQMCQIWLKLFGFTELSKSVYLTQTTEEGY